jgi:hypothetical protein
MATKTVSRARQHGLPILGTAVELVFPVVLFFSDGGMPTTVALTVMFFFHIFITSSIPMGVPIEWNSMRYYAGELVTGIVVESQPMGRGTHAWTIADAATGVRETGEIVVKDLLGLQPWPAMPND